MTNKREVVALLALCCLIVGCQNDHGESVALIEKAGGRVGVDDRDIVWSVHLRNNKAPGDVLPAVTEIEELTYLDLSGCPLTGAQLRQISRLTELRKLYLANSSLTDRSIESLLVLPRLRVIDVSENSLTADGLRRIGQQPLLEYCKLQGNDVSAAELETLRAEFPAVDFDAKH